MLHRKRTTCRICGRERLQCFLSLGPMPLANAFLRSPEEFGAEISFPLDVCFCDHCSCVQTPDVIDPELLFGHYLYVTGTSDTIAAHNRRYARTVVDRLALGRHDLVVEVASNDGSLLRCLQPYGVKTLGVEPAANIARQAQARGVETLNRFFNRSTAEEIRGDHGPAGAVIANNVLAHVDDTVDFLRGCRRLLADEGQVIVEVPYLRHLLERLEYDTIYHEHLCYFSITTLLHAFSLAGLSIVRIEHVAVHGGSLRVYARASAHVTKHDCEVLRQAGEEREVGLTDLATYQQFAGKVAAHRARLTELLQSLRMVGNSLAAYGAPAKGNTLLNFSRIGTTLLDFTVDRNPMKVGLFTPGMHLPVLSVDALLERRPDYLLILAWNFAEEIMQQQRVYRDHGGRCIIPIPDPIIL